MNNLIAWIIMAVLGIVMVLYYKNTKRPVRNFLLGAGSGFALLCGVNFLTTGLITVNFYTLAAAGILGIPGVVTTLLFNQFI